MALDKDDSMPLPDAEAELALAPAAPLTDATEDPATLLRELEEDWAALLRELAED